MKNPLASAQRRKRFLKANPSNTTVKSLPKTRMVHA